jgi:excisionase family DNA binding protein
MFDVDAQQTELPRLLTAEELSEAIGLSKERIWQLARRGQIPVVKLGRACRFAPAAVRQWIASGGTARGHLDGRATAAP